MCLAVPGKIIEMVNSSASLCMAKVSFAGVIKDICVEWLPNAKLGDYVLAHAGIALSLVDTVEAEKTLDIFESWAQHFESEIAKNNPG